MHGLVRLLRWTARASGLLLAGAYAALMIGDMAAPHSGHPSTFLEWAGISLLTTSAIAMLLAWRWELPAGLISLAAIGVHALIISGSHTYHMTLLIMCIPGVFYCVGWLALAAPSNRRRTCGDAS